MSDANHLISTLEDLDSYKAKLSCLKNNIATTKRASHDILSAGTLANLDAVELHIFAALEAIDAAIPNQI